MKRARIMSFLQVEQEIANKEWKIDKQILNNYLKRFGVSETLHIH
jgi:hypothetical protein